jgi:hypothetical protein
MTAVTALSYLFPLDVVSQTGDIFSTEYACGSNFTSMCFYRRIKKKLIYMDILQPYVAKIL